MRIPRPVPGRAIALGALLLSLLGLSCSRSLDESFPFGPKGGSTDPETLLQRLRDAGGGWAGPGRSTGIVQVLDGNTFGPIPNASVLVGNGMNDNDYAVFPTDSSGRADIPFDQIQYVDQSFVTATAPGYENLTVYASDASVYVLPLRPASRGSYTEIRGTVNNTFSADDRKFRTSCGEDRRGFAPLDTDGYNEGGSYRFFVPDFSNLNVAVAALEEEWGDPINLTVGAINPSGSLTNLHLFLPASVPARHNVGDGGGGAPVGHSFNDGNAFVQVHDEASRADVLTFHSGLLGTPIAVGCGYVSHGPNSFSLRAFEPGWPSPFYRGHLRLEGDSDWTGGPPATAEAYWNLPSVLESAGSVHLDFPGFPSNLSPDNGRRDLGPGPIVSWNTWDGSGEGYFEVEIRDPLRAFPENLVWRVWAPALESGVNMNYSFNIPHLPNNHRSFRLEFEREYSWRVTRYRGPFYPERDRFCGTGQVLGVATFKLTSGWRRFLIDIASEGDGQFQTDTLARLVAQGGGVAGSPTAISMYVRVFDALNGQDIGGSRLFVGRSQGWVLEAGSGGQGYFTYNTQDIASSGVDDPRTLTACATGYENTSFIEVRGHLVAIPLRPRGTGSYARLGGFVSNGTLTEGVVSAYPAAAPADQTFTSTPSSYDRWVVPDRALAASAALVSGSTMTAFQLQFRNALSTGNQDLGFNLDLSSSSHPFAPIGQGWSWLFYNAAGATSARSTTVGFGASPLKPWETLLVGKGGTSLGNGDFTAAAARVPEVQRLAVCLEVDGSDNQSPPVPGRREARLQVFDLGRSLDDVYFPNNLEPLGPPNGGNVPLSGFPFDFLSDVQTTPTDATGPCVVYVEEAGVAFPAGLKWRVFSFPNGPGVSQSHLPALTDPEFMLTAATNYDWRVEQLLGGYFMTRTDANAQVVGLGKFSLGTLERFRAFRCTSAPWSFTGQ